MVKDSVRATAQMATMGIGFIGLAEGIDKAVASSIEFEKQMELIHTQAAAPQSEVRKLKARGPRTRYSKRTGSD
jgi:hypothetical protein